MKQFDAIAQIVVNSRMKVTCKEGETYKEAALRKIKNMSTEDCKEFILSSALSCFHVPPTVNNIIYLMVDEIIDEQEEEVESFSFIDSIEHRIHKEMPIKEIAKIFTEEIAFHTRIQLKEEVATDYARRIVHLLHTL